MKIKVTKESVVIIECASVNQGEFCVNKCTFELPECFDGLTVTAAFNNIPVPLMGNECYIPTLKKGTVTLGVYAYKENDDGVELMYSPKPVRFYVGEGSYNDETETEEIPEISKFEEYCNHIASLAVAKSDVVDEFDIEETYTEDQILSAWALSGVMNAVAEEIGNIHNEIYDSQNIGVDMYTELKGKYEELKEKTSTVSNALKGRKSSRSEVVIDDISPIEHNLNIALSGSSVSGASVVKHGKNILGLKGRVVKDLPGYEDNQEKFDGNGIYTAVSGSGYYNPDVGNYEYNESEDRLQVICDVAWYGLGVDVPVVGGEKYTLSAENVNDLTEFVVSFYDESSSYISFFSLQSEKTFVAPDNAAWAVIILTSSTKGSVLSCEKLQLEKGDSATEYEKFIPYETYVADSMGGISVAVSSYPTTVLEALNKYHTITVDYNKDINVVIDKLISSIVALGGDVNI